jgi:FkbM family methyltransferase
MKTIQYNKKELIIGSIAEENSVIQEHMSLLASINLSEVETDEWFLRFNSQIKEMNNFLELTKDKKILFDIGSQFGLFSFSFLGNSLDKQVFAFDGGVNPFLTTTQIKLINKLTNFNTFNFLIGNKNEIIKCHSEELQSLAIPGNDTRLMFSIDMMVELFNTIPDTIKIDIEGCEYQALVGAYNTIIKHKPIIFIEIHPRFLNYYQNNIEEIAEFVKLINYDVYDLNKNKVVNYLDILKSEKTDSNRTVWMPNLD